MKIFLDTADVAEIREFASSGLVDGVTTNPSLAVRGAVVNAALQYNWMFVLEDMAAQEQPGDLGEFLRDALRDGIAPPEYNELGEPDWLYEDEGDEGDSDEEDDGAEGDEDDEGDEALGDAEGDRDEETAE